MEYLQKDHRKTIYIPELDETVYLSPMSVLEHIKIKTLGGDVSGELNVWTVIEKAQDKDGNNLLSAADKPFVEKMPTMMIAKIANLAMGIEDLETVKKTSETTPSL